MSAWDRVKDGLARHWLGICIISSLVPSALGFVRNAKWQGDSIVLSTYGVFYLVLLMVLTLIWASLGFVYLCFYYRPGSDTYAGREEAQ